MNSATGASYTTEISGWISIGCVIFFAEHDGGCLASQIGNHFFADPALGIDPSGCRAVMSGIVVAECSKPFDDFVQVRVVEHDDWSLASQLQLDSLRTGGRGINDPSSYGHVSSQRNQVYAGMIDQMASACFADSSHDFDADCQQIVCHDSGEQQIGEVVALTA